MMEDYNHMKKTHTAEWMLDEGFKICTACDNVLPLADYHKDSTKPGGINRYCKRCKKTRNIKRNRFV